jgi:hypothetical protein
MSRREDEDGVIRTFARIFQDAYLERSQNRTIPFVQNKTAQSDFYRIIDLMDSEIGNDTSPHDISKKLILTLLQCAARLYEGDEDAKEEATNLIKCREFRTILSVGIQDKLSQAIHEQFIASIRYEGPTAENSINAGLFSAKQKNEVRQLDSKAILIENIVSLCYSQLDTLQNVCESARVDEPFMFRNFTTLVGALSFLEMSWLIILFPYIFQWPEGTSDDAKASDYKLVARYGIPSSDSAISCAPAEADRTPCGDDKPSNHGSVSPLCTSPNLDWSFLDEDDATEIFRFSPEPDNNASTNKPASPPLFYDTDMMSKELHGRVTTAVVQGSQAASTFVNSSKAAFGDEEAQQRSAMYHSLDAQVDGELLQLFADMKLQVRGTHTIHQKLSQLFEDPALIQGWLKTLQKSTIKHHDLTTAPTFISVFKNAIAAGDRKGGHKEEQNLSTIPEESEEQAGPEEGSKEEENKPGQVELKTVDLSFLELPCALEKQRLREVRYHLGMIQVIGWDEFWKRAEEGDSILADVFATILWMAESIRTFRKYSNPTSFQLISIQMDPASFELALRFSRGDRSAETIFRIRGQMKDILGRIRVTEAEFLPIVSTFATAFDNIKSRETLCQMVHWFGQNGEYRTFLAGFVPAGISGKDKRGQ